MLGRYRLGKRLGGGGMAEVFHATLIGVEGFSRPVAIKRVQPVLSADVSFGQMFINEARLASLLHHPNIAGVLDFDRDEQGLYFLVMELVQGCDAHRLVGSGSMSPAIAAHIIADVLRGLAYAHELVHEGKHLGLVHRDVSPHNVMLSWDGSVKLVDFGIAKAMAVTKASLPGSLKGKIGYMSPEQAHGHPLDGRSDVFSVGVMFHEFLSGTRLFKGATEPEVLARLLNQPIASPVQLTPGVPHDLAHVAMRMLERDRKQRYGSARQALEALLRCQSMSARASLDLQDLMRERFPDEAPRRSAQAPSVPRSTLPLPPTLAAESAMTPRTLTAGGGPTPLAVGERATTTTEVGSSRLWMWIVGALAVSVACIAVAVVMTVGGNKQSMSGTQAPPPPPVFDAGVAATDAATDAHKPAIDRPVVHAPDAAPIANGQLPTNSRRGPKRRRRTDRTDRTDRKKAAPVTAAPAEPGELRIVVDPWAKISVDGTRRGSTPRTLNLAPGPHTLVLRNTELGKTETVTIHVVSGKRTTIKRIWN